MGLVVGDRRDRRETKPMTHEHLANGEHADGPEYDHNLPDAANIPTYDDPEDSDAPPLAEED